MGSEGGGEDEPACGKECVLEKNAQWRITVERVKVRRAVILCLCDRWPHAECMWDSVTHGSSATSTRDHDQPEVARDAVDTVHSTRADLRR